MDQEKLEKIIKECVEDPLIPKKSKKALRKILSKVSKGQITPEDVETVRGILERSLSDLDREISEYEKSLERLEKKRGKLLERLEKEGG
jgi:hypothetical protein